MTMKINETVLTAALDWAYEKALRGAGPFSSAAALAQHHVHKCGSKVAAAQSLVNWQVAKCATSGFVTGLGGLMTLPVAIPANISSVLLMQLRMVLSIAIIGGFDPRSEGTRSLAFACLTGSTAPTILEEAGIKAGIGLGSKTLQSITEQVANRINYLVKMRLLTKTGKAGLVKLGRVVPLVGGVVGGTIDAASTTLIGKAARRLFLLPALGGPV